MSDVRNAYVKKMKAILDGCNAEITELEAIAKQHEADAQKKYAEQIETLEKKRKSTGEDLVKMQQAGASAWKDLMAGFGYAAHFLGEAIRFARYRKFSPFIRESRGLESLGLFGFAGHPPGPFDRTAGFRAVNVEAGTHWQATAPRVDHEAVHGIAVHARMVHAPGVHVTVVVAGQLTHLVRPAHGLRN